MCYFFLLFHYLRERANAPFVLNVLLNNRSLKL